MSSVYLWSKTACAKHQKKTSVGIISPYTAQVTALKARTGNYQKHPFLSVQINTVDSFQGDEKDIIILSTVRNNKVGNIGFLDSGGRANVALTRARYITFFPLDPLKIYIPVHFYLNFFSPTGIAFGFLEMKKLSLRVIQYGLS